MPEEKTKPEAPAPILPPAFGKAKAGDHVVYFAEVDPKPGGKNSAFQAILAHVDANGVAALKVPLPASRKGGGGVKLLKGVAFSEKPAKGCWGV